MLYSITAAVICYCLPILNISAFHAFKNIVDVAILVAVIVVIVVVSPNYTCSTDLLRGIDCRFAVRPTHLGGDDSRRMAITR